jgi:hypothetical protein
MSLDKPTTPYSTLFPTAAQGFMTARSSPRARLRACATRSGLAPLAELPRLGDRTGCVSQQRPWFCFQQAHLVVMPEFDGSGRVLTEDTQDDLYGPTASQAGSGQTCPPRAATVISRVSVQYSHRPMASMPSSRFVMTEGRSASGPPQLGHSTTMSGRRDHVGRFG